MSLMCPQISTASGRSATTSRANRADRKSTRLNSSHGYISYAVFCLKKKIVADAPDLAVYVGAVGDDGPAVAEGAQVLLDDEAGADCVAVLPDLPSVPLGVDRLGMIL